jgi:serine/tyrosine/threonine adenylyltransferase
MIHECHFIFCEKLQLIIDNPSKIIAMRTLNFDNRFTRELPRDTVTDNYQRQVKNALWSIAQPTPVKNPQLLAFSSAVANMLGLTNEDMQDPELIQTLGGNGSLAGMVTYATRYGGHQFGHWAGQLGDGRAILLGELVHEGKRFELQLKGAGETPYSRRADGRAVLRSSLREFLCSEAMHYLGVPTTRALSLVSTGDLVRRDMFYNGNPEMEPGAIVCRVAPSFTRPGHFELMASNGELDLLKRFIGFTIDRDFSKWLPTTGLPLNQHNPSPELIEAWFEEICERTAILMAHWMRVGFVHGVMNTDNLSIIGLTIDYGPYGWIDNFDPGWTPNTTDAQGRRYCFGRQPDIARWNMERLADALATILPTTEGLADAIAHFDNTYMKHLTQSLAGKFGLDGWQDSDGELVNRIFELMTRAELDMTLFFNKLAELDLAQPSINSIREAFYTEAGFQQFGGDVQLWLNTYAKRVQQSKLSPMQRIEKMQSHNPRYVLRNYMAQEAIDLLTESGDNKRLLTLLELLKNPYTQQVGMEQFEQKRPDWARQKAGCSMLSCSS